MPVWLSIERDRVIKGKIGIPWWKKTLKHLGK